MRVFHLGVATLLVALWPSARAQQAQKVPRIAYLTVAPLSANATRVEAFRQGLSELRYVEGKNIVIECDLEEGSSTARMQW
jgi:hypothetical protein